MTKRLTMTIEQVAKKLGIGRNNAYEAAHCGQIPTIRIGKPVRNSMAIPKTRGLLWRLVMSLENWRSRPMWIVHTFGPDQFFGPFRSKLTAARWAKKNLISASNAVTIMRAIHRKARMARRAK